MNTRGMDTMTLAKESLLLIGICVADLASTLLLLSSGGAVEGNPIMAFYLKYGIGAFVMAKLTLVFLPIFIAEWGKQYRPRFVRKVLRATIGLYVGMYLIVFLAANVSFISKAMASGGPLYLPPPTVTSSK